MKVSLLSLPTLALVVALPMLGASPAAVAGAGPQAARSSAGAPTAAAVQAPRMPTLVAVRASHRGNFDRVVFKFRGPLPTTRLEYVDRLYQDGSGRRLRVAGQAILQVRFEPAKAHTWKGAPTAAPRRRAFNLPNVMTAVRAGDFEGQVTYGLGLAKRTRVAAVAQPGRKRVVVRVRAAFPTVTRQVYFLDRDNFATGTEPYFVATNRRVIPMSPAVGVMDRLFAGPTPREFRRGLRFLRSGATTYSDLEITDGVARVRLRGRCSSGGSTATIAGEIMPTLRQFASVDWVKIYDQAGQTATPGGPSDSIPGCLEP